MKSVMKHQFSQVPSVEIPRSSFDRTHGYKTTFDAGYLIPFYCDEVLPGDTFNCRATIFARLATPIAPLMDNMVMETFYFAVPLRLVWDNFQKFMGERTSPEASTDFLVPQVVASEDNNFTAGSLSDYFGLPTGVAGTLSVSAFWHRAYNLIWNDWFRDQNLQEPVTVNTGDGPDDDSDYALLRRGKRHDYFTSALPWPQKGPGVELPLGSTAPIVSTGDLLLKDQQTVPVTTPINSGNLDALYGNSSVNGTNLRYNSGLAADLSGATAATINSLRQAFQLQRMLERDARGGTRYTEIVRSHFGTISPDSRLQRPEFLGGSSAPVSINPVQQTSSTDSTSPQGNLAAFGIVASQGDGFTKSFTEHCVIIGLVNVRADLTYQSGIPRMFSRQTRYDFYWPALAHLGEQAILNKEIFTVGGTTDDDVFGYQERWAEYRYFPSQITGKMRSNDSQSLDVWHLSQEFSSCPVLSSAFIEDNPPIDRVIAVPSEPHFLFDSYIQLHCARPMPVYSVPGLIDHF